MTKDLQFSEESADLSVPEVQPQPQPQPQEQPQPAPDEEERPQASPQPEELDEAERKRRQEEEEAAERKRKMAAPRPGGKVSPINGQPLPTGNRWEHGEKQREIASRAGKASVAARRRKKSMKEELIELLTMDIPDQDGNKTTTQKAISLSLIREALNGNVKAFETIRDTVGERPVQEVVVDNHLIPDMTPEEIAAEYGDMPTNIG